MTTLSRVKVKCGVCGSSSWQMFLSSYYSSPRIYFDSSPEGINPACCFQCCSTCNYCAPSIEEYEQFGSFNSGTSDFDDHDNNIDEFLIALRNKSLIDCERINRTANIAWTFLFPSHTEPLTDEFFSKYLDLKRFSNSNEKRLPHEVDKDGVKKY